MINHHNEWLDRNKKGEGKLVLPRANLSNAYLDLRNLSEANLSEADLSKSDIVMSTLTEADLSKADMSDANLRNADLGGSNLEQANLSSADLGWANLSRTNLGWANLSGAFLVGANFSEAVLANSDLSGAVFYRANLTGVDVSGANMSGANFLSANLTGAYFQPDSLPSANDIASAIGLERLEFGDFPSALVNLKKSFDDAGLRHQAKLVNTSLKRHDQSFAEYILFDLTCKWGANWLRPLLILFHLCLFFSLIYIFAVIRHRQPYKYLIVSKFGLKEELSFESQDEKPTLKMWETIGSYQRRYKIALLFSAHGSLRLGFRELNPSYWLTMFLPPEFELKSRGWPRILSGVQSLISIYLIALSLLSYFGKPFDY